MQVFGSEEKDLGAGLEQVATGEKGLSAGLSHV